MQQAPGINWWIWGPALHLKLDPLVIARTWTIYDCIEAWRVMVVSSSVMRELMQDLPKPK